jgi:hypothetical protein
MILMDMSTVFLSLSEPISLTSKYSLQHPACEEEEDPVLKHP